MKRFLLSVLLLLFCAPAWAGTKSKWMKTGGGAGLSTGGVRYWVPMNANDTIGGSEFAAAIIPAAGTVRTLYVRSTVAPENGAGTQSWTVTFRKNGSDTALTCVISEAETTCNDTSDSISLAANDLVTVSTTPANTPATARLSWIMEFEADAASTTAWLAVPPFDVSGAGTRYLAAFGSDPETGTQHYNSAVIPMNGTITAMKADLDTAPGAGASRTFTLTVDGSDSELAITYSDTSNGLVTDTGSVSITAGQRVEIRSDVAGAPPNSFAGFGFTFAPSVDGEFVIASSSSGTVDNTAVSYMGAPAMDVDTSSETDNQGLAQNDITIKTAYVWMDGAPGAGTSYTLKLRQNGADASVPFTVTIADAATSGNASGSFVPAANSQLAVQVTPSGTPTARFVTISYAASVLTRGRRSCCLLGVF